MSARAAAVGGGRGAAARPWGSDLSRGRGGKRWRGPAPPAPAQARVARRKPDIPVPYLYFDMGAAVLCASFMSFGVKRRWFALGAALQLAVSTYAAYVGGHVHYGDWLKVSGSPRTPPQARRGRLPRVCKLRFGGGKQTAPRRLGRRSP